MSTTTDGVGAVHAPIRGAKLSAHSPANWITKQAHDAPGRRCFVAGDGRVHTFGEINRRVNRLARALLGYQAGTTQLVLVEFLGL